MKSIILTLAALLVLGTELDAKPSGKPAGAVTSVSGKVTLISTAATGGSNLKLGQPVYPGDRIKTGANGRAQLVLSDGTQLKINYVTDITLRDTDVKGKKAERGIGSIKIALGNLWAKVTKKNSRLEFETPAAVAAVKGTEPEFDVDELGNLCVKLKEGALDLNSDFGAARLDELKQICIKKGIKFDQGNVTDWDGNSQWLSSVGGASSGEATIKAIDTDGQEKSVILEYDKK